MRNYWLSVFAVVTFVCPLGMTAGHAAENQADYVRDVQPIFKQHCYQCHGPSSQQSNYRLDVKSSALGEADYGEPTIVPGNSGEGLLIGFITGKNDHDLIMPPEDDGRPLNEAEVTTIRRWIDAGAPWPKELEGDPNAISTDHWSFQTVQRPTLPKVVGDWPANAIDRFILAKLTASELTPSPEADRVTLIRRLYLDMLGLPPTPAQIAAFEQDRRSDAWPRLVDQVLANPHYGERWGRHWLDVVRFAESAGFETNHERPNAYHYRDYVIKAFNDDKPYNEFVFEQIAGDQAGADAATGFLVGGPFDNVKSPDANLVLMQRQDELADIVGTTSTSFLGLTMACARCHNHKFDPLLQKDYYSMVAVFRGVRHGDRKTTSEPSTEQIARAKDIESQISTLEQQLRAVQPPAHSGETILIDDRRRVPGDSTLRGFFRLSPPAGTTKFVTGNQPGQLGFRGGPGRLPHLGGEQYSWWKSPAGKPVAAYRPRVTGDYDVWVSWAAGIDTHTKAAQYVLDRDGDLATKNDQQRLATINQQILAGTDPSTPLPSQSLWSGFVSIGRHAFTDQSVVFVANGADNKAVTGGTLLFQQIAADHGTTIQPILRDPVNAQRNEERFAPVLAKFVRFTISETNASEPCIDELELWTTGANGLPRNVALASAGTQVTSSGDFSGYTKHRLPHIHDGKYGNSFSWISNESGRGWVQLELAEPAVIDRIVWGRDRQLAFQDRLATEYKIEVTVKLGEWRTVASSLNRVKMGHAAAGAIGFRLSQLADDGDAETLESFSQLDTLRQQLQKLRTRTNVTMYSGTFVKPPMTHLLYRGDPMAKKEIVAPDIPTISGSLKLKADAPEQQRRVELAQWIASKENPLTARVMVNRLWHYHFGTGIVDTPSDFGGNGAKPTHPELLDWMAAELVSAKWSIKHMHRLILNSHAYQQSGKPRPDCVKTDAGTRLLWRFPPRRLEAEAIRDSILAVSGALDKRAGGPGYMLFEPNSNYSRSWIPKDTFGPTEFRRMIYAMKIRMEHDSVFGAFDCPDAGQVAPQRGTSTTALQALNLLNSPFMLQQSELLAERLKKEAGAEPVDQVRLGFHLVSGRAPSETEVAACLELIEQYELRDFCRALFNTNEFLFIP